MNDPCANAKLKPDGASGKYIITSRDIAEARIEVCLPARRVDAAHEPLGQVATRHDTRAVELEADGDKKLQSNGGILVCATLLSV